MKNAEKIKILFLCTGNSCRSQMAEGWAKHLKSDCLESYSAGIRPQGVNPLAVAVMAEEGIDISSHQSQHINELNTINFDFIITVCSHADDHCPTLPGSARKIHFGFDDPPKLAEKIDSPEGELDCYRRVRDEIRKFIEGLPAGVTERST